MFNRGIKRKRKREELFTSGGGKVGGAEVCDNIPNNKEQFCRWSNRAACVRSCVYM
jgi:hypothetical protein